LLNNQNQVQKKREKITYRLHYQKGNFAKKMIVYSKFKIVIRIRNIIYQKWKWLSIKVNQVEYQDNLVELVHIFINCFKVKLSFTNMLRLLF
jgi:hypothetical protein